MSRACGATEPLPRNNSPEGITDADTPRLAPKALRNRLGMVISPQDAKLARILGVESILRVCDLDSWFWSELWLALQQLGLHLEEGRHGDDELPDCVHGEHDDAQHGHEGRREAIVRPLDGVGGLVSRCERRTGDQASVSDSSDKEDKEVSQQ